MLNISKILKYVTVLNKEYIGNFLKTVSNWFIFRIITYLGVLLLLCCTHTLNWVEIEGAGGLLVVLRGGTAVSNKKCNI